MADARLVLGSVDTRGCTVLRWQLCPAHLSKPLTSAFGAASMLRRTACCVCLALHAFAAQKVDVQSQHKL